MPPINSCFIFILLGANTKVDASCQHVDNAMVKAAFCCCFKENFGGALACCCIGKKKNTAWCDNFSCVFFCLDGKRGGSA
eukprot:13218153-Ditylum_brightwellii.AAC.2